MVISCGGKWWRWPSGSCACSAAIATVMGTVATTPPAAPRARSLAVMARRRVHAACRARCRAGAGRTVADCRTLRRGRRDGDDGRAPRPAVQHVELVERRAGVGERAAEVGLVGDA